MADKKPATNKQNEQGVFDVAKPGKSKPNAGSRPIIVTHKPMMEDPMVKKQPAEQDTNPPSAPEITDKQKISKPKKRLVVAPLDEADMTNDVKIDESGTLITPNKTEKTDEANPVSDEVSDQTENKNAPTEEVPVQANDTDETVADDMQDEENKSEESPDDNDTEAEAETTSDNEQTSDASQEDTQSEKSESEADSENSGETDENTGLVDELAKQAASKKQQQEEDKQAAAQAEKINELIAAKTYFVPVTHIAKRRVKYLFVTIILLALLAAVGLNFAIDAELVDIGVAPLTDLL